MTPDRPTLNDVLNAYAHGWFPMADARDAPDFHWYEPKKRGQLSIEDLHIPRSLEKKARRLPFEIRVDTAFDAVIRGCAASAPGRESTWINDGIIALFNDLHGAGYAHSVECWRDGELAGGIYGLALGGLFCGESMFSRAPDASRIALLHLCARLWHGGFTVFDTQFVNPHLLQFGAYEVSPAVYRKKLAAARMAQADFHRPDKDGLREKKLLNQYLEKIKNCYDCQNKT